jgi:diaminohydroxyphosphoribosylaminopyrimidine deaminase/5-amino-6-(5-phosphoribosylamino)uracil reductase
MENYMRMCFELASKAKGKVLSNPLVGAVIVKEGRIISKGYHHKFGDVHAEVDALNNAIEDVTGATIYCNLEPCSHYGKQPPCANRIIESGIKKVVISNLDPNKLVSGKGVQLLKDNGVEVITALLEDEGNKLNEKFFYSITHNTPFIALKTAMSLDGKIALSNGESKWITSKESREYNQKLRNEYDAILVGINTVIKDNPMLNCRIEDSTNPIKIVLDSNLRIPLESYLVKNAKDERIILATISQDEKLISILQDKGVEILVVKEKNGKTDIYDTLIKLKELGISSLIIEGGASVNYSALEAKVVNKVYCFIAPKLIGGINSLTPVGGLGVKKISEAYKLVNMKASNIGNDILVEAYMEEE